MNHPINRINSNKFTASITLGLHKGYSQLVYTKKELIAKLQEIQEQFIKKDAIYLSCAVSDCQIVLSGQIELSVKLDFINYPKFTLEEKSLKKLFYH